MTDPVLHTPRLTLRPPQASDWPVVSGFMATSERLGFIGGRQEDEFVRWRGFLATAGHWTFKGFGFFTVLRDETPVGRVGVIEHPAWEEPELGWHLFDGHEGQGYATEAALAVRDWAHTALGLGPLISYIDAKNAPSLRVAERLGARFERETTLLGHPVQAWRHPVPDADGSPEAYA
ncbi:GNAT family N-acetyltransferase [Sagittula salina]|uniref:GNAT family N-acetyltransferase n=1 Tax=Sagittula salina TaxID=2820268 RepID=A0A940S2V9_9RHOB|nr:GNAT family N-acetyltransferase [Sagittula salina]MBP0482374.1 GNAT family N-acetyltransferase [Sagittula salina]